MNINHVNESLKNTIIYLLLSLKEKRIPRPLRKELISLTMGIKKWDTNVLCVLIGDLDSVKHVGPDGILDIIIHNNIPNVMEKYIAQYGIKKIRDKLYAVKEHMVLYDATLYKYILNLYINGDKIIDLFKKYWYNCKFAELVKDIIYGHEVIEYAYEGAGELCIKTSSTFGVYFSVNRGFRNYEENKWFIEEWLLANPNHGICPLKIRRYLN